MAEIALNPVASYAVVGRVAVVTIDSPPVNALSAAVRQGMAAGMARALADTAVGAIVLICAGRTFIAGADITEFGKPPVDPSMRDVQAMIEDSAKPVVAAIHGTALGGGLEMALVAGYRVAVPSARLGLPEVNLGLLPGAGGTQRLTRVVGVEMALTMIAGGKPIPAARALEVGLLDAIVGEASMRDDAVAFAERVLDEGRTTVKVRDRTDRIDEARLDPGVFERFAQANARKFRGQDAPAAIIRCIEAAVTTPFDAGMIFERDSFRALLAGPQSAALRHMFFAERQAVRIAGVAKDTPALPIARIGIVGAGTMGRGVAMSIANAGMAATLVERDRDSLDRGLASIRESYAASVARGKLAASDVDARMASIRPSTDPGDLADADLIVEAAYEDADLKRDLFAALDRIARPDAILASNTSFLDLAPLAQAAPGHAGRVIGLHFFSPAHIMKLVEIVRLPDSDPSVLATAAKFTRDIGKVGVAVRNSPGFVGNRIVAARRRQAEALVLEGASPADVDRVLRDFGFPMGHFEMRDMAGLDIGWTAAASTSGTVRDILNERGRHGRKSGAGYYDYDGDGKPVASAEVEGVIAGVARRDGIARRRIGDEEIRDRLLLALVNEAAKVVEEGLVARASDIDVIWHEGYGWPRHRGGPIHWAEQQGLPEIHARLVELERAHGEAFRPAPLIVRLAGEGGSFKDVDGAP